ncbi:MAG: carboxypeptidase-like regulatory domain-containing protein [Bryobacteraceae bacterium]
MTGKILDRTDSPVPAIVELSLQSNSSRKFNSTADASGTYRISGLPAGKYILHFSWPGFHTLRLTQVSIADGQTRELPNLHLDVGLVSDCAGHGFLDKRRLLKENPKTGLLKGRILKVSPSTGGLRWPVASANVTLLCEFGRACGRTKTDALGGFTFSGSGGNRTIQVTRTGYYLLEESGYAIEEGIESVYHPTYLEKCPSGSCDSRLRPEKPVAHCE